MIEDDTNKIDTNKIDTNKIDTNKIDTNKIDTNKIDTNKIDTNKLDALLRKYLSVWLWSILFGGVTTLTFSLVNIRDYEKWGILTSVTGLLLAISIIFLIIAWMTLFQFLKSYLIGTVFVGRDEDDGIEKREKYGRYLSMSFYALIMAGILRLMIELSKQIFQIF